MSLQAMRVHGVVMESFCSQLVNSIELMGMRRMSRVSGHDTTSVQDAGQQREECSLLV